MADVRGSSTTSKRLHEKIVISSDWTEDSKGHYLIVDLPDFKKEEVKLEVNISTGHITVSGQRQVDEKKSEFFEQNFTIPPNSDIDNITGNFDGEILYVTIPTIPKVAAAAAELEEKKEPEILEKDQNVTAAGEPHRIEKNQNVEDSRPKKDGEHSNKNDHGTINNYGEKNKLLGKGHIFFSLENIRKWEHDHEEGILRTAKEIWSKNKRIIITAVAAFSLGMLVSRKFQSAAGGERDQ